MTDLLFREDAYLCEAEAVVIERDTDLGSIVVDRSVFYPAGGGQAGDRGRIAWEGGSAAVRDTRKAGASVCLVLEGDPPPDPGTQIRQHLDWEHRHRCMRIHTALHLLSVVIPLPVTGGQITPQKGRLDFDMPDAPEDRDAIEASLNALIDADYPVSEAWITDAELDANPGLVKTMSVQPPRGSGRIRLIRIGDVDLQPCGGTHVRSTGEIGRVVLGKIEKKGRQNRRVAISLA